MNSVFGTWQEFLDGKVFLRDAQRIRMIKKILRSSARRIIRNISHFTVGIAVVSALVSYHAIPATAAQPLELFEENLEAPSIALRERFRNARLYLNLTQVEAAKMLRISESSLEKFEVGAVNRPHKSNTERYLALIRLANLYQRTVGKKTHLIRSFLRTPSYYYGGKSALEFATSRDTGIFDVVGMERRKHA